MAQNAGDITHRAGFEAVVHKTIDTVPEAEGFPQNCGGKLPSISGSRGDCQDLKASASDRIDFQCQTLSAFSHKTPFLLLHFQNQQAARPTRDSLADH
jgi:hypothetical protein